MSWWPWKRAAAGPADPEGVKRDLDAAEQLLEEDDPEGARALLEQALERHRGDGRVVLALGDLLLDLDDDAGAQDLVRRHRPALRILTGAHGADAWSLEAELASTRGELEVALAHVERGLKLLPDDPRLLGQRGGLRLDLARFDEARADLEKAYAGSPPDDVDPALLYDLACLAERAGQDARAEELFARAESLEPDDFPRPVRIGEEAFDRVVKEALDELPDVVRKLVDDGAMLIQTVDLPPEDVVRSQQDPLILGLYEGEHVGERSMVHQADDAGADGRLRMNRVSLYKKNIKKAAGDLDEVREQIRITLLHEVGHHLGFDEEGLDRIGLA